MLQFEELLAPNSLQSAHALTRSRQKGALLDAVRQQFDTVRMPIRLLSVAQNVADELTSNAFYNAPVDKDGHAIYAEWDRRREVVLEAGLHIQVNLAIAEKQWAICVRDPFGSLTEQTLRQNITRAAAYGSGQVRMGNAGAGIGLLMVVNAATHLVVKIAPRQWTEFIAILESRSAHRDLHQKIDDMQVIEVRPKSTTQGD